MNSEKDDLMLLRCSLKPKALPMCPLDLASPVVSIHNTRAYGSRGGSKVNAMKKKKTSIEKENWVMPICHSKEEPRAEEVENFHLKQRTRIFKY